MRELYSEIILELSKDKSNFGEIEHNKKADAFNALCGDSFVIYAMVDGDKIDNISFTGSGCAISSASASLLSKILKGKEISEAKILVTNFLDMVANRPIDVLDKKIKIFESIKNHPSRIKCANLVWHAMKGVLEC